MASFAAFDLTPLYAFLFAACSDNTVSFARIPVEGDDLDQSLRHDELQRMGGGVEYDEDADSDFAEGNDVDLVERSALHHHHHRRNFDGG